MNKVAIIQARMGSSRLPGKVLMDIAGKTMIQRVVERARRARTLDIVSVATTIDASDNPIAAFAITAGVPCTRGNLHDVLDRYYQAARTHKADIIVRITADCPAIDPALVDQAVTTLLDGGYDFVSNRLPPPFTRTFPIGLDVEVCTFAALQRAWQEADQPFHHEHVMPFLYEDVRLSTLDDHLSTGISPRGFKIALLNHTPDYGSLRWTVDTPEDLELMRRIFNTLEDKNDFTWYDLLAVVQKHPELAEINARVRHKTMTEVDERRISDHPLTGAG
ncbi:MAG: glycosyltransferase family protein [Anaerolineales bacterium]